MICGRGSGPGGEEDGMRYTSRQGSAEGIFRQSLQLLGRLSIEGRRCMASAGHIAVEGCSIILSLPFVVIHVVGYPGNNRRQTSRYHVNFYAPLSRASHHIL